jgi:hypothetical protein
MAEELRFDSLRRQGTDPTCLPNAAVKNARSYTSTPPSGLPKNFFRVGGQQIQLRIEGRENGDLGAVAP